jgi:hypothetical protein
VDEDNVPGLAESAGDEHSPNEGAARDQAHGSLRATLRAWPAPRSPSM